MHYSPWGSSVHEIFQVRRLQQVTMPSSRASSWRRDQSCVSYVCLLGGGFLITSAIFWYLCESRSAEITQRQREQSKQWESESCPVVSNSLWPHGIYSPWNSPRKNTGVSSISLLQGIFPTQGSNPGIPNQADSSPAEPQGKPKYTGVGSLSFLQQIFQSQESNPIR